MTLSEFINQDGKTMIEAICCLQIKKINSLLHMRLGMSGMKLRHTERKSRGILVNGKLRLLSIILGLKWSDFCTYNFDVICLRNGSNSS